MVLRAQFEWEGPPGEGEGEDVLRWTPVLCSSKEHAEEVLSGEGGAVDDWEVYEVVDGRCERRAAAAVSYLGLTTRLYILDRDA